MMDERDPLHVMVNDNEIDGDQLNQIPDSQKSGKDNQSSSILIFCGEDGMNSLSVSNGLFHSLDEPTRCQVPGITEEMIKVENVCSIEGDGSVAFGSLRCKDTIGCLDEEKVLTLGHVDTEKSKVTWYVHSEVKEDLKQEDRVHMKLVPNETKEIVNIDSDEEIFAVSDKLCEEPAETIPFDVVEKKTSVKRHIILPSDMIVVEYNEIKSEAMSDDGDVDDNDGTRKNFSCATVCIPQDNHDNVKDSGKVLVDQTFQCTVCKTSCKNYRSMKKHMRIHTKQGQFKCFHCDLTFSEHTYLKNHMRVHTGEKPYVCIHCDAAFSSQNSLRSHTRTHTGERPFKCQYCDAAFPRGGGLKSHIRTNHTGEKPHKCPQCPAAFSRATHLRLHSSMHTGYKPYKCDVCDACFNQACNLKTHMRIHTGEKPFKCSECSSAFAQLTNLKAHLKTHVSPNERLFQCSKCNVEFTTLANLKIHMKTDHGQTDKKPFSCPGCQLELRHLGSLQAHMKKCQEGRKCVKCDICGLFFKTKGKLNVHKKSHFEQKPYLCSLCGVTFVLEYDLAIHLKSKHSTDELKS